MPEENLEGVLEEYGEAIAKQGRRLQGVEAGQRKIGEKLTEVQKGAAQIAGGERPPSDAAAQYFASDVTYNNIFKPDGPNLMGGGILDFAFDSTAELWGFISGGFKPYETPEEIEKAYDRFAEYEARIEAGEARKDKMKVMEETLSNLIEEQRALEKIIVSKQLQENFQESQELNGGFKAYETPEEGREKIREALKYEPEGLGEREKAYKENIEKTLRKSLESQKEGLRILKEAVNDYFNNVNQMNEISAEVIKKFYRKKN